MAEKDEKVTEGVLSPFRVLDCTGETGFLCGKILGDLGADVIKIEPPGGDPARARGPFYRDVPHPERSLYWWAYNNNKRGITLNLDTVTGREIFRRLLAAADFVIESFPPGYLDRLQIGYTALCEIHPRLILTSITPFGQTGPYRHLLASDLEIMAMSGTMSLAGEPDRPPLRVSLPQSPMWAGAFAAMGTLFAHYHREQTGEGQHVDVSSQASMLWALSHAPMFWDLNRENPQRAGAFLTGRSVTGAKFRTIWPCKDGYITFIIYGGPAGRRTNQALTEWMASERMAPDSMRNKDWSSFDVATVTQREIDAMEEAIGAFLLTLTKEEFFTGVIARDMLGYPVATAEDIFKDPQLTSRGFWEDVTHPELGETVTYPGAFAKFGLGTCRIRRRAPLIGEHNREIYEKELGFSSEELRVLAEAGAI